MADPATYTKGSWTNLLPAATKAKLENIENGIKANNDALVAETDAGRAMTQAADAAAQRALLNVEDGADVTDEANVTAIAVATDEVTAAPDHIWGLVGGALKRWTKAGFEAVVRAFSATTAAAGTVMLATTGVEAATKVPKATGAEIAALLTAGGYTLTAPSGANSLDGIADTSTWKKVAATPATALNASTIVAGTQWGSGNDGNGGQPPAPKPSAYADGATSHAIGNANRILKLTAGDFTLPATGTYTYISVKWDSVTGLFSGLASESGKAGGSVMDTTTGNQYCAAFVWRTA